MTGVQSAGHDVLGGIGVDGDAAAQGLPQLPTGDSLPGPPPKLTDADKERLLKEQKRAVKKAKKAAKKVRCVLVRMLYNFLVMVLYICRKLLLPAIAFLQFFLIFFRSTLTSLMVNAAETAHPA